MPKWTAKHAAQQPENRAFPLSPCCPFTLSILFSKARSRHTIAQPAGRLLRPDAPVRKTTQFR